MTNLHTLLLLVVAMAVLSTRRGVLPLPTPSVPPGLESVSWTAAEIQLASEASSLINDLFTGIDHSPSKGVPSTLQSSVLDDFLIQARLMADEPGPD